MEKLNDREKKIILSAINAFLDQIERSVNILVDEDKEDLRSYKWEVYALYEKLVQNNVPVTVKKQDIEIYVEVMDREDLPF